MTICKIEFIAKILLYFPSYISCIFRKNKFEAVLSKPLQDVFLYALDKQVLNKRLQKNNCMTLQYLGYIFNV